jgi:hypothetical protein
VDVVIVLSRHVFGQRLRLANNILELRRQRGCGCLGQGLDADARTFGQELRVIEHDNTAADVTFDLHTFSLRE